MRHLILLLTFTCLIILLASNQIVAEQPSKVCNTDTWPVSSTLITDSSGLLHVFWDDFNNILGDNNTMNIWYSQMENGIWTRPVVIVQEEKWWQVAIDKNDTLHLFWVTWTPEGGGIRTRFFCSQKPNKEGWSAPELIIKGNREDDIVNGIMTPTIVFDSRCIPHIVFDSPYALALQRGFYLTKNTDGSWAQPVEIPTHPFQLHGFQLAVDNEDTLYLAWSEYALGHWMYAIKPRNGEWSIPTEIARITNPGQNEPFAPTFTMLMDSKTNLHFLWRQNYNSTGTEDDIFYACKPKLGNLSKAINISETPGYLEISGEQSAVMYNDALYLIWHQQIPLSFSFPTFVANDEYSKVALESDYIKEVTTNGFPSLSTNELRYRCLDTKTGGWTPPISIIDNMIFGQDDDMDFNSSQIAVNNDGVHIVGAAFWSGPGGIGDEGIFYLHLSPQDMQKDTQNATVPKTTGETNDKPPIVTLPIDKSIAVKSENKYPMTWGGVKPNDQAYPPYPRRTASFQNYPNPFNPETWIPYQLAETAEVDIKIYSADGILVRRLELGRQSAGFYTSRAKAAYWDGRNETGEKVASGVYFYTIKAGDFTATKKLVISK